MPEPPGRLRTFLLALAVIALATAVRAAINPLVGTGNVPFIAYFPAVAAAAWLGGVWPGVFSALLSYLVADLFFIPPVGGLAVFTGTARAVTECVVYLLMSGLIVGLAHGLHRSQELYRAEARLAAERGETLRITLASIGDGVIATDDQGKVDFMNAVAEQLTGWPAAEARGRPLGEVFHIINEQTRRPVENPTEKVLRTGKVVGLANHTVLISRSGGEAPIDDSAAPILDNHGNVHGVVLVFTDATEKRRATTALQTLAAIVEHSDDAIISKDRQGIITSWNHAAERMYGYTAEEMLGKHISAIVPAEHQNELNEVMGRLWSGERIEHWDTVRLRKDGSLIDVSLRISPIKDSHGDVIGASKVARDITERKRAEAVLAFLAETSASLAALVDRESALQQAAETMIPFFADWCIVYLGEDSAVIESQACAHRDSAKRQLLSDFMAAYPSGWETPSATLRAWRQGETQLIAQIPPPMLEHLAANEAQLRMIRELDPLSAISVPLQIRDRVVGVMSFVFGESGRRYTEADVPLAEDLARRVAIALDNAMLLHSVKAADRQKDEFLAMLAHELRNPLAAIRYATEAARVSGEEFTPDMLDLIERQVTNLARLIDDLLDISRISRDKIQLRRETIDASIIVRRAAATVQPLITEKNHSLAVELASQPMPIHVDPTRAEQIVANLLTNAAKYTHEGGRITLRAYPEDSEAVIKVTDTGIGIARDTLPYVFELFAQADRTLDRSQGGLGIGLTVVRKLAEMHGGSVAASSEGVGQGSEFTVRLPLTAVGAPALNGDAAASRLPQAKLRVLVVDDNHDTAKVEALLLKKFGHEVEVAHDGAAALAAAERFRPHAVLLDIGLPVLNGYDVAAKLREQGYDSEQLIAVSGYGQAEDKDRSRRAGFGHHLVKPVNSDTLLAILQGVQPVNAATA